MKVTIEIDGDDVSRLLQAAFDRNETIGGTAKQLLHAALRGMPLMDEPKAKDRPKGKRNRKPAAKKRRRKPSVLSDFGRRPKKNLD